MKKVLSLIAGVALLFPALLAADVSLALGASYLAPADGGFKEVYGSGGVLPGLRLELVVAKGFSAYASYGYFAKKGTTPALQEEASSTQHYLALGATWRKGLSARLGLGLWAGALYAKYEEEALGMTTDGSAVGLDAGIDLRFTLSGKLFLSPCISYKLASDRIEDVDIKLGGFQVGIGLGISL